MAAKAIAKHLDAKPEPFILSSERGFLTITGRYKETPISIISIGMGSPNMDFFVREVRELGSCGGLVDVPPGTVVVPGASVQISRNVDFDFVNPEGCNEEPYHISKLLFESLEEAKPSTSTSTIVKGTVNASADSFYSSQGRQTSFPDSNADLINHLEEKIPNLATLEMETFHLFHLAACWTGRSHARGMANPPLATNPVSPSVARAKPAAMPQQDAVLELKGTTIRAAGAHMVFASRKSRDFITPEQVNEVERVHADHGSVWEL
ncbi:hypothetical protein D9619_012364 [Psilocybe cf. subviscida]|uniref:Nucleoside phosphorylase domain-containing protein n=1 Tax=Psilocybe cf. subviscida TaxID=2480587 RepID=A0A8H5ERE3_9AGAR|nr:hypothetical protein D9619_012364 [Psilocybe cf. subviscida]